MPKSTTTKFDNAKLKAEKSESPQEVRRSNFSCNKLKHSGTKYKDDKNDNTYTIKVINFVAIKIPVDEESTPPKRRRSVVVKNDEKPPCPVGKPPPLPKEATLEFLHDETAEEIDFEKPDEIFLVDSVEDSEFPSYTVKINSVETKQLVKQDRLSTNESSYESKFCKPKRKRMLDYFPEELPKRMTSTDKDVHTTG